jgi:hypothetical protein
MRDWRTLSKEVTYVAHTNYKIRRIHEDTIALIMHADAAAGRRRISRGHAMNRLFMIAAALTLLTIAHCTVLCQIPPALGWYRTNGPGDDLQIHVSDSAGVGAVIDSAIFSGYLLIVSLDPPIGSCYTAYIDNRGIRIYPPVAIGDTCFVTPFVVQNIFVAFAIKGCLVSSREMTARLFIISGACKDTSDEVSLRNPNGEILSVSDNDPGNRTFALSDNYPNPFNPSTTIRFQIPDVGAGHVLPVQLKIYNLLGQELATLVSEQLAPGTYSTHWDGSGYPSGIYFYRLQTDTFVETKRIVLLR